LREVAERMGVAAYLVDGAQDIDPAWVQGRTRIGLTAGASAPEVLLRGVCERLRELGAQSIRSIDGVIEDTVFPMPRGLGSAATANATTKAETRTETKTETTTETKTETNTETNA
jgi:4-hydroxy-3-methylbut-2-enyl diphosphate reductase